MSSQTWCHATQTSIIILLWYIHGWLSHALWKDNPAYVCICIRMQMHLFQRRRKARQRLFPLKFKQGGFLLLPLVPLFYAGSVTTRFKHWAQIRYLFSCRRKVFKTFDQGLFPLSKYVLCLHYWWIAPRIRIFRKQGQCCVQTCFVITLVFTSISSTTSPV